MSSQDGGLTWERILYNDSLRSIAGKYSFSPNMAYNRQSQRLGVVYYSNEMSPSGRFGRVNGLIYNPATREVQVRRISGVFPFPGKEVFFGDYLDVCAFGDGFKAVWNQPDSMEMSGYTNVFGFQNNQDEDSMACFFEMAGGDPYITVFLESKQMGLSAPRLRLVNYTKGSMGKVKLKSSQWSVQRVGAGNLCGYEWKFQIRGIPLMQPTDVCVDFKNDSRKFSGLLMKGI
jgi:hypothetical protein